MGLKSLFYFLLRNLRLPGTLIYIAIKEALFHRAVRHHHLSVPMLNTVKPLPNVLRAVRPDHLTLAMPLVFKILSLI